ncbi:MAG: indole-3-glycerol phosphate synthase TrpC [Lachnospiraceae bacterium]|nr:indole-3-glycerol phosphate synthase TrpC [Lachnospiraceae bacterium]
MILDELVRATSIRIEKHKSLKSLAEIKKEALSLNPETGFPFKKALMGKEMSFICEVKKASPSKGLIAEDFPYLDIAKDYEKAGADAISCLTETDYFLGRDEYLRDIAKNVSIPVLRKDFTIDEYMIYEAKVLGASAVLLICSLLDKDTLKRYLYTAHSLGLSALVEAHDEAETEMALTSGAGIIGVNNRNLKDFTVDISNSVDLKRLIPDDVIYVSESGIRNADDVAALYKNGTNAVLIGELLMRSPDKEKVLNELRGKCHD